MARQFGKYSPKIPLGVTWEEPLTLEDEDEVPIDLTGYDAVIELYTAAPVRDPDTGLATVAPLLQITTVDYHAVAPDWPVSEGITIPTPTNGTILVSVEPSDVWLLSETNTRVRLYWAVLLVIKATGYCLPVVSGRPTAVPSNVVIS